MLAPPAGFTAAGRSEQRYLIVAVDWFDLDQTTALIFAVQIDIEKQGA